MVQYTTMEMKIGITLSILLSLLIVACSTNKQKTAKQSHAKMKLIVLSHYGTVEKKISDSITVEGIITTMNTLDWQDFHQVVLSTSNKNWIEVGGNLKEDGLSAMYEENGKQFVINKQPVSVKHMTDMLLSYFKRDGKFKIENRFE